MIRTENYLREFFAILFGQKHVIFWTTAAILAGAVLVLNFWPPMYSASCEVLVSGKQVDVQAPEAMDKKPTARPFEVSKEDLASEKSIIVSAAVVKNALRALASPPADPGAEAVVAAQENLTATVVPASNVITVEYLHRSPREAARFLDALMKEYQVYRMQFYRPPPSQLTPPFLADRADQERAALDRHEQELVSLVDASGVADPQIEIQNNIILKKRLEEELNVLNGQAIELESTLDHMRGALERKDVQYFAFLETSPTITKLAEKLAELNDERGKRARVYRPESEVVTVIDEQIRGTFGALKAEAETIMGGYRAKLDGYERKRASLEESLRDYDAKNVEMQKQIVETLRIKREAGLAQYAYETLSKRKGEVEIDELLTPKDTATVTVSLMGPAFASSGPVFPKPLIVPLGLIVGLIMGFSFGFLREYFDHTFKKPSDVTAYVGLPVICSLSGPPAFDRTQLYLAGMVLMVLGVTVFTLIQYRILPPF